MSEAVQTQIEENVLPFGKPQAPLEFHPLAALFQLIKGPAYAALVEDIRRHGLLDPIVLYEGKILDGRNRYRGCLDADQPIRTVPYEGTDPLAFVRSRNLSRRHSNESQRAMGAARLANIARTDTLNRGLVRSAIWRDGGAISQEDAAGIFNVSLRSIQRAVVVLQHKNAQPEVIEAVDDGLMTVAAAASIVTQTRERQLARIERDKRKAAGTYRQEEDYYRTPAPCTRALLRVETFVDRIWEPACGNGAISQVLIDAGHVVISSDLIDRGFGESGVDFLEQTALAGNIIVTNPPYEIADQFALHALHLGAHKVALLCRLAWLEGQERYGLLYSQNKLARVWVFSPRQTLWRGDDDAAQDDGGMTAYAWFVFEAAHQGPAQLGWLTTEEVT